MAHRTAKINDTVKFTDQQQAILNDAAEQLMEAGGLTALTQAHFNEAMKIVAQRFMADTLALGYVLGATPCTRDFHPLERAHAERTKTKGECKYTPSLWTLSFRQRQRSAIF